MSVVLIVILHIRSQKGLALKTPLGPLYTEKKHRPKEMNVINMKVLLRFFLPICPFAPSIFSQVTPRHVLHL
jgi:hypothetical protein